jgi:hypothetical protein
MKSKIKKTKQVDQIDEANIRLTADTITEVKLKQEQA